MSLHGVAPDRVYIVLGVLLEIIFVGAADLSPRLCILKILKYIKYSCDYQSLLCVKISRCPPKNYLGEVPNPCLHGPGALLPHLFTLTASICAHKRSHFRKRKWSHYGRDLLFPIETASWVSMGAPFGAFQRYISVALVLGSPPAGVTRYPCPVEPGLSSPGTFRFPAAAVQSGCERYCT